VDVETLKAEFAKLGPWIFQFRIDGIDYGGGVSAIGDKRLEDFHKFAPAAQTILELGALEGAHSFLLAQHPSTKRVLALEGREANIRRARFVQERLGITKVEFLQTNLEQSDLAPLGRFDAVFCSGLLYHLPRPWELIQQLASVAPKLFLWTMYSDEAAADSVVDGFRGRTQTEGGADEPLSGLSSHSLWLTLGSLIEALTRAGYGRIEIFENNLSHPQGRAVTLGATVIS
jgi:SAM-dependent methyltransferase